MAKAKKSKESGKSNDGKMHAIVAHIGWIGWIIALILDKNKDPLARFYIRQTLILYLAVFLAIIPFVGWVISLAVFIFWILSLIGAINGEQKEVPLLGKLAQDWFKGL